MQQQIADPSATRVNLKLAILLALAFVAAQGATLWLMGLPLICKCGTIDWWYANPSGSETSQHLTDWYTYTHVIHGFAFYLLLWLIAPRMSFVMRLAIAVGLEAGWEILENTPIIMDRYRQSALARGYFGDSVINSVFDTIAMTVGFILARVLPIWASVALVAMIELYLGLMIRDNFTLNVIQLIYPSDAISRWQAGD